jgi:ABC-type phosphate/phosphonate transport system substrate-binding protein
LDIQQLREINKTNKIRTLKHAYSISMEKTAKKHLGQHFLKMKALQKILPHLNLEGYDER